MWSIYAGETYLSTDYLIYDDQLAGDVSREYMAFSPTLSQELNKIGSLQFTIYPQHPNYNNVHKLKTWVSVYLDGTLYWYGRVLNDKVGSLNQRAIQCEEFLGVLHDTIQRPFEYPGTIVDPSVATPANYLAYLIGQHNSQVSADKQITVGTVTVTDPNNYIARSDTEYTDTYDLIQDGLISTLGGYLVTRYTVGGVELDYVTAIANASNQPVQLGLNLMDISTDRRGEDTCTAILPLGVRDEETGARLTISSLTDGAVTGYSNVYKFGDIVYSSTAETSYGGRIVKVITWDDVTEAANLRTKAAAKLAAAILMPSTITITAADASAATIGAAFNPWQIGQTVTVVDAAHTSEHGLASTYVIQRLNVDMSKPQDARLQLNGVSASLAETTAAQRKDAIKIAVSNITINQTQALQQMQQLLMSAITQTESAITSTVADLQVSVYGTTDLSAAPADPDGGIINALESATGSITTLEQRADGVDISISTLTDGYTNLTTYFGFGADGLTINKSDDEVYALYSNAAATFQRDNTDGLGNITSTEVFATIGASGVTATEITSTGNVNGVNGVFEDSVQVGPWAWIDEGVNGFTLKYYS